MYPLLEGTMVESVFQEVDTYVYRHQNTVAQFIRTRLIIGLFLAAERSLALRVAKRWW